MKKPCKIPRDLKPGDRLWYSKIEYAAIVSQKPYDTCSILAHTRNDDIVVYSLDDGSEIDNDTPPITRIERVASKPAKVKPDKDAAWLRRLAKCCSIMPNDPKRLRAIAKRLDQAKHERQVNMP